MAYLLKIEEFKDHRGSLFVGNKLLPFEIKRFYFMKNIIGKRGGYKHQKSTQAIVCINGRCNVQILRQGTDCLYNLEDPATCLIVEPNDWHELFSFSKNATVLVFSSDNYDKDDYVVDK
jgi:hypothetical protein